MGDRAVGGSQVADELAIRNLLAAVAQRSDSGELADYLDLYTDDAVWEMPDNPQVGVGASRRAGRSAIAAGVEERRALGVQGPGSATIHVVTTSVVRFRDDDRADVSSYWLYYADAATTPVLRSLGQYEDVVRRTGAGWRLAHRRITTGGPAIPGVTGPRADEGDR